MKKSIEQATEPPPATLAEKVDPKQEPALAADLQPRKSERLAAAISAAETRITALHDTDLPALEKERDRLAGSLELDDGAVARLTAKKEALRDEEEMLQRRIELLAGQKQEAEKVEAQERMSELARALDANAEAGASLRATWNSLLSDLQQRTSEFAPILRQRALLSYELQFLQKLYELPFPQLAASLEPPLEKDLSALARTLRQLLTVPPYNPFAERQERLLDERRRAQPDPLKGHVWQTFKSTPAADPLPSPSTPPQPPPARETQPLSMGARYFKKTG